MAEQSIPISSRVTRVDSTPNELHSQWTITITRMHGAAEMDYLGEVSPASDVPDDVRAALQTWLHIPPANQ